MLVFKKWCIGFWIELIIVYAITIPVKSLGNAEILPIQESTKEGIRVCIIVAATIVAHIIRRFIIYLAKEQYQILLGILIPSLVYAVSVDKSLWQNLYSFLMEKRKTDFYLLSRVFILFYSLVYAVYVLDKKKTVGEGLAHGYYHGFLRNVLSGLNSADIDIKGEKVHVTPVLNIIIPKDCHTEKKLDTLTDMNRKMKIEYIEAIYVKVQEDCGVTKKYNLILYSLTPNDGRPKRYIIAEYASTVQRLREMMEAAECNFSKEDLTREVEIFNKILCEILDMRCHVNYRIIHTESVQDNDQLVEDIYKAAEED